MKLPSRQAAGLEICKNFLAPFWTSLWIYYADWAILPPFRFLIIQELGEMFISLMKLGCPSEYLQLCRWIFPATAFIKTYLRICFKKLQVSSVENLIQIYSIKILSEPFHWKILNKRQHSSRNNLIFPKLLIHIAIPTKKSPSKALLSKFFLLLSSHRRLSRSREFVEHGFPAPR